MRWLTDLKNKSRSKKLFVLNWLIYMVLLVVTTAYVYGRLDFVRSGQQAAQITATNNR